MGFLDNILSKKKDANSFLPVDEQNLEEQASNTPVVVDGDKSVTAQENIQAEQSAALPEVKYPNKPQNLDDGEYEYLLKYYSPEAINKVTSPFDPSKGENVLQRFYESSIPKPSAPNEKQLKNKRLIAGIADGVSMLSQMFSAAKGAHVKERNDFALPKMVAQEKEDQNKYMQLAQKYNDGLLQSRLKDFQLTLDDYNNERKGVQSVLAKKQKLDEAARQADAKMQYNYDRLAQDQTNKDADRKIKEDNQKSLDRYRKSMEAQGWSRVTDSRNKTSAYIKKLSSGSGKNSDYQMVFSANPNDTNAQTDSFGNKVKVLDINKGHVYRYAREALSDRDFLRRHPQFDRKPRLRGETPKSFTEKERVDIAVAYMQEQYNKSFIQTPDISETLPMMNWGQMNNVRVPEWDQMLDNDNVEIAENDNTEDWNWID